MNIINSITNNNNNNKFKTPLVVIRNSYFTSPV